MFVYTTAYRFFCSSTQIFCLTFRCKAEESAFSRSTTAYIITRTAQICVLHPISTRNAIASGGMIIFYRKQWESGGWKRHRARAGSVAASFAALGMGLLCGCASPGPVHAPSLKLPKIATGLAASRVGDEVRLRWTTPSRTTDKELIAGPIEAEICRVKLAVDTPIDEASRPCAPVVLRETVTQGESESVDRLPAELTTGAARLLAYRVQLRNAAGRTAGATAAVYAVAGAAPEAVVGLRANATKAGVVLEWRVAGDQIELNRTTIENAGGTTKKSPQTRLRVAPEITTGKTDTGGMVDRTALSGQSYRYSAQRVRTVELAGKRLQMSSVDSPEVVVERKDVFAPDPPVGLVAVPGFADQTAIAAPGQQPEYGSTSSTTVPAIAPAIDLSWEPDPEPRVAGYRIYRREMNAVAAGAWRRLDQELLPVASYRDLAVETGRRYAYRVTAVDTAGNESAPSDEVEETAPTQ